MRCLTFRAFCALMVFDLSGLSHNFSKLHTLVKNSKVTDRVASKETTQAVCDAVNQACVWYPKRVLCLQRSAVTTRLLRKCGVPAAMVLGAQRIPFKAHAWVEVDGHAVNERSNVHQTFGVWERC